MRPSSRPTHAPPRGWPALAALFAGACTSEVPAPAGVAGLVRLDVDVAVPLGVAEGPLLAPDSVRLRATPPDGRPEVVIVLPVQGRRALGQLTLERRSGAERWRLRGAAAVRQDTLFRAVEDVEVTSDAPRPQVGLRLIYAGADAAIASLRVTPRDTTLDAAATMRPRVSGIDAGGIPLAPPVGWRSRQASVATVDADGRVTALAAGQAWIVARTWTGMADSALVRVRAPARLAVSAERPAAAPAPR